MACPGDDAAMFVVLCRSPDAPDCKTRLAREVGRERARELYIGCLENVLRLVAQSGVFVRLAVPGYLRGVTRLATRWAPEAEIVRQVGDTFASRQAHEIRRGLADGYRPVVLVCSDLLDLTADALTWALTAAARENVGIVPSPDGGYALLGASSPVPELAEAPMSRADTAAAVSDILSRAGHSVVWAPFAIHDLDVAADLTKV